MQPGSRDPMDGPRIESWKEIAAFFGRDERTVKRWEKTRSLPIHRLPGDKGGVFAYASELTAWVNSAASQRVTPGDAEPSVVDTGPIPAIALPDAVALPVAIDLPDLEAKASAVESVETIGEVHAVGTVDALGELSAKKSRRVAWVLLLAAAAVGVVVVAALELAHSRRPMHLTEPAQPSESPIAKKTAENGAQEFYLKGRYYWNHRTDDSLKLAVEAFTQAIVRDPQYAPAYAGLADTYDLMPQYTSMPKSQAFPLAIAAARKAVALDDSLSEAHRALGFGLFYWEWDVNAAFREYQRAIELDPKDVEAHNWYATSLMLSDHLPLALAEIEKARELDPTSRVILANQALIVSAIGTGSAVSQTDRDQSISKLRELERTEPDFLAPAVYLSEIFFVQGDFPAYIVEAKRSADISKEPEKAAIAEAAARGWSRGRERGMLEELLALYKGWFDIGRSSGYDAAHMCALLGRKSDADKYLEAAVEAHDFEAMTVFYADFNEHMKGDPGFEQIKRQIRQRMMRSPEAKLGQ